VPCALPGALLPGGLHIKPVTMRGVQSAGMLCSAKELGLSQDHQGLMMLDDALLIGQDLREALRLEDQQFLLKLTPNRPDCLGVRGIARELAALSGAALSPAPEAQVQALIPDRLPVRIEAADLCGRFCGRVIRGVNPRAITPSWMKERLERAGQRSISALVDISNYVMLELSRPTHVFDLDKIEGSLTVRWAKRGERLKLLNGNTIELDDTVGVIADEKAIESLAGIMGGDATAVSLDTENIYLEAAFWWPQAMQGRARRYNFSTDAAHRFERGVDYATTVEHIERITALIVEICGVPGKTRVGPVDDQQVDLPARKPVAMRLARAAKIIGIPLSASLVADIFTRLALPFTQEADVFSVTPPSYRFDWLISIIRKW